MEGGGGEGGEGGEREGEGAFVADDRPLKRVNRKTRARDKRSRERERERARAREKARDREREIYYERFPIKISPNKPFLIILLRRKVKFPSYECFQGQRESERKRERERERERELYKALFRSLEI